MATTIFGQQFGCFTKHFMNVPFHVGIAKGMVCCRGALIKRNLLQCRRPRNETTLLAFALAVEPRLPLLKCSQMRRHLMETNKHTITQNHRFRCTIHRKQKRKLPWRAGFSSIWLRAPSALLWGQLVQSLGNPATGSGRV